MGIRSIIPISVQHTGSNILCVLADCHKKRRVKDLNKKIKKYMEEIHKTEQKIADLQQYLKGLHAALKPVSYTHLVCPYDRNLPLYLSCTDPIRNDEQQRVGTDRNELFQRTLCPGIPGISDDGMCCYLCSISGRHPVFR